jgi:hypothetical protein
MKMPFNLAPYLETIKTHLSTVLRSAPLQRIQPPHPCPHENASTQLFFRSQIIITLCKTSFSNTFGINEHSTTFLDDDDLLLFLQKQNFACRHIPVWARHSPLRTRVKAHVMMLSP